VVKVSKDSEEAMFKAAAFFAILVLGFAANVAIACPDGQYMACVGPSIPSLGIKPVCTCVPNSGTVVHAVAQAANPLPDTLQLFGAVAQGNINQAYSSLGSLVTNASCPSCAAALSIYATPQDKAVIEELIGRGWLAYVTGNPVLFVVNAGGTHSQAVPLNPPPPPIAAPVAPRGKKTYIVTGANCAIVHSQTAEATAGWVDPPTLVESGTNTVSKFPDVDLRTEDVLKVSSNDSCQLTPAGDVHVKTVNVAYKYPTVVPGTPTQMKYFLTGKML
jgi:hypothetical protein